VLFNIKLKYVVMWMLIDFLVWEYFMIFKGDVVEAVVGLK